MRIDRRKEPNFWGGENNNETSSRVIPPAGTGEGLSLRSLFQGQRSGIPVLESADI